MSNGQQNGLWIGFWMPQDVAEQLAVEGGVPPDELHLTLAYVPNVADDEIEHAKRVVQQFAANEQPLAGVISGVGRFYASETSDGLDVIYASFDGPALPDFRQALVQRLRSVGIEPSGAHGYSPHITLAYVGQDVDAMMTSGDTKPVTFDSIQMRVGGNVIAEYQLGAPVEKSWWEIPVEISKVDEDQRLVFGWLSVAVDENGSPIEDSQNDIIPPDELEHAAYEFVLYSRQAGEMHRTIGVGRLVESMVFTVEKQAALGIPPGILPVGWWVGFKIDDPEVWAKVKSGDYAAFSIGGWAIREEVT